MTLYERVQQAVARLALPGITGWGLSLSPEVTDLGGEMIDVGPVTGCNSDTCRHESHSPAAPDRRWIPPEGSTLVELGRHGAATFFALLPADEQREVRFLRLFDEPAWYHAILQVVDAGVPEYLLARLADPASEPAAEQAAAQPQTTRRRSARLAFDAPEVDPAQKERT